MNIRKILKLKEDTKIESDGGDIIIVKGAVFLIDGNDDDLEVTFIPKDCLNDETATKFSNSNKSNKRNKLFIRFTYDSFIEDHKDSFEVLYDIDEIEKDEKEIEELFKNKTK